MVSGLCPCPCPRRQAQVLYTLIALNNLIYDNRPAQDLLRDCGGIPRVLAYLRHPGHDVRKTAAFCIGNCVKGCRTNAEVVAAEGGIMTLVALLNDEEDDELSKKVRQVLVFVCAVALRWAGCRAIFILTTTPHLRCDLSCAYWCVHLHVVGTRQRRDRPLQL